MRLRPRPQQSQETFVFLFPEQSRADHAGRWRPMKEDATKCGFNRNTVVRLKRTSNRKSLSLKIEDPVSAAVSAFLLKNQVPVVLLHLMENVERICLDMEFVHRFI